MKNVKDKSAILNDRIKRMRKYLKLSQAEFGTIAGVSQSTQNRYETPGRDIPVSYLEKIYERYKYRFNRDWLFYNKGKMLKKAFKEQRDIDRLTDNYTNMIGEVEQFSAFLNKRSISLTTKRRLLELLVESMEAVTEEA